MFSSISWVLMFLFQSSSLTMLAILTLDYLGLFMNHCWTWLVPFLLWIPGSIPNILKFALSVVVFLFFLFFPFFCSTVDWTKGPEHSTIEIRPSRVVFVCRRQSLSVWPRLVWTLQFSCLSFSGAGWACFNSHISIHIFFWLRTSRRTGALSSYYEGLIWGAPSRLLRMSTRTS